MPAPASVQELLDLVQKSGVADEGRLKTYLSRLEEEGLVPTDPSKLAGQLVRDGLLTYFQAEQILQGKWKRFSIGKYKVLERLGAGGMGTVFLCEHKLMRRRVAVKVLPIPKAEDKASLERFYREARAVAAVDHPNIVRAYDIDQDDNLHFLVMEYVDGTNLQDLVKKSGPLDVQRACHYIYGAAVGLQHAHEIGLVHRDIKPGNILIDRSGVVKILDMGLARFFNDDTDELTKKYDENVLGTADYLSPEQALDSHTVDIRADIYSLGATFYYLLTGSAPFPEGSVAQKLIWHQSREPRPIQSLRPAVTDELAAVIQKMMAKDQAKRYQTPSELMAALAPWVATPIPPPDERELPQLSPAATGVPGTGTVSRGTGSAPALSTRPPPGGAPSTLSGSPTVVAPSVWSGGGPAAGVVPSTPFPPPASPNGVWESLEDDTQPVAHADTARPRPTPAAAPTRNRQPSAYRHPLNWRPLALIGVLVLLVGCGFGAYYAFFRKVEPPPTPEPSAGGRRLLVTQARGSGNFPSILLALKQAAPGDTIVIADERIAEPPVHLSAKVKDLTIESGLPGGKPALIESASSGGGGSMFEVVNGENVRLRNLELDGKGSADAGVSVTGSCPGVTFENVSVRGVRQTGFRLRNAAGDATRPITIDRCRVQMTITNEAGVSVTGSGELDSKRVTVRNCRFEGPGKAGIRFDGPVSDIEVSGNRLFQLDVGFAFGRVSDGKLVKAQITGNTLYDVQRGVAFEFPPGDVRWKMEVLIAKNYFAKTGAVARAGDPGGEIAGVTFQDNGFDKDSQPGNMPNPAVKADGPDLPAPNPADDATFLRFPSGAGPTVGPNKVRVGAS
ncbi:MAG TPA: protein kinase [Gemmataceae bacterium]|nr:protein kinase [Gemmataceae bacterium]